MNNVLKYKLKGTWSHGKQQTGQILTRNLSTTVGIYSDSDGNENMTTPEELLLSAAASCYMITLSLLLENRNIPYQRIELESEAIIENDKGLRLDRIAHYPEIVVDEVDSASIDKIAKLTHHAEHTCMVSSALRGNVEVVVYPRVTVTEAPQKA
jgi:peroxiredoxin-like protein